MIYFACPSCQKHLKAPADGTGTKVSCPRCGQRILIPPAARNPTVLAKIVSEATADGSQAVPPSGAAQRRDTVAIQNCPVCGLGLSVDPEQIGKWVECPNCRTGFIASLPEQSSPRESEAQWQLPHDGQDDRAVSPTNGSRSSSSPFSWTACFLMLPALVLVLILTLAAAGASAAQVLGVIFLLGVCSLAIGMVGLGLCTSLYHRCPACSRWLSKTPLSKRPTDQVYANKVICRVNWLFWFGSRGGLSGLLYRTPTTVQRTYYEVLYHCPHCDQKWTAVTKSDTEEFEYR
jgi:ssDNA-binding Zn-finger/Zn-ribbon topoisomerase 1